VQGVVGEHVHAAQGTFQGIGVHEPGQAQGVGVLRGGAAETELGHVLKDVAAGKGLPAPQDLPVNAQAAGEHGLEFERIGVRILRTGQGPGQVLAGAQQGEFGEIDGHAV
jgi:hypothetical protein